jgi:hypothetical protein
VSPRRLAKCLLAQLAPSLQVVCCDANRGRRQFIDKASVRITLIELAQRADGLRVCLDDGSQPSAGLDSARQYAPPRLCRPSIQCLVLGHAQPLLCQPWRMPEVSAFDASHSPANRAIRGWPPLTPAAELGKVCVRPCLGERHSGGTRSR